MRARGGARGGARRGALSRSRRASRAHDIQQAEECAMGATKSGEVELYNDGNLSKGGSVRAQATLPHGTRRMKYANVRYIYTCGRHCDSAPVERLQLRWRLTDNNMYYNIYIK